MLTHLQNPFPFPSPTTHSRFLPEPDLAPILISEQYIAHLLRSMPELLEDVEARLSHGHGLPPVDASTLAHTPGAVAYYETALEAAAQGSDGGGDAGVYKDATTKKSVAPRFLPLARLVSNWVLNEVSGALAQRGSSLQAALQDDETKGDRAAGAKQGSRAVVLPPQQVGKLVHLVQSGAVSGKRAKDVLELMAGQRLGGSGGAVDSGDSSSSARGNARQHNSVLTLGAEDAEVHLSSGSPDRHPRFSDPDARAPLVLVTEKGWVQLNDRAKIAEMAAAVINDPAAADQVSRWRDAGQDRALGALVARVLEASGGLANPELASVCVREALGPLGKRPEGKMGRKEKARQQQQQQQQQQGTGGEGKAKSV